MNDNAKNVTFLIFHKNSSSTARTYNFILLQRLRYFCKHTYVKLEFLCQCIREFFFIKSTSSGAFHPIFLIFYFFAIFLGGPMKTVMIYNRVVKLNLSSGWVRRVCRRVNRIFSSPRVQAATFPSFLSFFGFSFVTFFSFSFWLEIIGVRNRCHGKRQLPGDSLK